MPDVLKQTVSASQIAAVFNRSPYDTRFTLWQWFKRGIETAQQDTRMSFGKFIEPFVLAQVQERLRLEVIHNREGQYFRRGALGCTRDATVIDPTRGPGIVQVKAHAYPQWRDLYTESMTPPHIEMQLQTEMAVHDARWGIIAVMVGQNDQLLLYEREPIPALQAQLDQAAAEFLASVTAGDEPDALGSEVELPVLDALYPEVTPRKIATVADQAKAEKIAEDAMLYDWAKEQRKSFERVEKEKRAIIAAAIGDAERLDLPGVTIQVSRSSTKEGVMQLPAAIAIDLSKLIATAPEGFDIEPIRAAATWGQVTRAPSVRTTFKITPTGDQQQKEDDKWLTP